MQKSSFSCPECGQNALKVLRTTATQGQIVRRRECTACKQRFTTKETFVNASNGQTLHLAASDMVSIGQILKQATNLVDSHIHHQHHGEN